MKPNLIKCLTAAGLAAVGGAVLFSAHASAQIADVIPAMPSASVESFDEWKNPGGPPNGVPPELHRKVVSLYQRISNAYPDIGRKRAIGIIADELDIHPERLWNAYTNSNNGPVVLKPTTRPIAIETVRRPERVEQRPKERARGQNVDRVSDRVQRFNHVNVDRVARVRPVRERPIRQRPVRERPTRN